MSGSTTDVRLFVYGTLRRGGAANGRLEGCRLLGPARVRGTLHEVGWHPALVLAGDGEVHGELWSCPPGLLADLDRYERVDEGLFLRVEASSDGGTCWTYVAGPLLAPELSAATVIPGGRWEEPRDP